MQDPKEPISVPIIYIEVFILMFISFLIGYLFAYFYQKRKYIDSVGQEIPKSSNTSSSEFLRRKKFTNSILVSEDSEDRSIPLNNTKSIFPNPKKNPANRSLLDLDRLGRVGPQEANALQKITGIGPYTEERLNNIGIYTFKQIANFNERDIDLVTQAIHFFPDRIKSDRWVEKAKLLQNQSKI